MLLYLLPFQTPFYYYTNKKFFWRTKAFSYQKGGTPQQDSVNIFSAVFENVKDSHIKSLSI